MSESERFWLAESMDRFDMNRAFPGISEVDSSSTFTLKSNTSELVIALLNLRKASVAYQYQGFELTDERNERIRSIRELMADLISQNTEAFALRSEGPESLLAQFERKADEGSLVRNISERDLEVSLDRDKTVTLIQTLVIGVLAAQEGRITTSPVRNQALKNRLRVFSDIAADFAIQLQNQRFPINPQLIGDLNSGF